MPDAEVNLFFYIKKIALLTIITAFIPNHAIADQAGEFDFYVLALSWSPSYCRLAGERASRLQCGRKPRPGFVVHGLWPQFELGYPESCPTDFDLRLSRELIDTILDLMPSPGLVGGQWRKHGTCTGLSPADYLQATRAAYETVTIPDNFVDLTSPRQGSARTIESAFVAANPGMSPNGIAISCKDQMVSEVRICLTRDLRFTTCKNVDSKGCRRRILHLPIAKAGRSYYDD